MCFMFYRCRVYVNTRHEIRWRCLLVQAMQQTAPPHTNRVTTTPAAATLQRPCTGKPKRFKKIYIYFVCD